LSSTAGRIQSSAGFDLAIERGAFVAIVGESGSGKTTLLRIIAGLEAADAGSVMLGGREVHGVGSERGMVFQEPRLLPWLTVRRNVSLGLELRGLPRLVIDQRAGDFLDLVGLGKFAQAYPGQLSGGMAQRVGIARALATNPEILLLDEPLGALDAMTRLRMQCELERIWQEQSVTMIMVTHDIEEAVYLADKIIVMSRERDGVREIIPVALPRPRDRSCREFVEVRETLLRGVSLEYTLIDAHSACRGFANGSSAGAELRSVRIRCGLSKPAPACDNRLPSLRRSARGRPGGHHCSA
jgi:sulfonate transport system ATP-binding protein